MQTFKLTGIPMLLSRPPLPLLFAALLLLSPATVAMPASASPWSRLPSLPDPEGYASAFAGISHGALLVAGGANFPGKRPWEGGTKIWTDRVFVLPAPGAAWREPGRLPRPLAYGISVSTPQGVLCAGGGDAHGHVRETFLLQWDGQALKTSPGPQLPRTCAFGCGALVGPIFYLAGGIETPDATTALNTFWALDTSAPAAAWRELPPCPGPARMLAVAGAHDGVFYLFGGVALHAGADGKPQRTPLRDAYAYTPAHGWTRLVDLPRAVTAAPSPAPVAPNGELWIISGDDGLRAQLTGPDHPGFPTDVLAYDPGQGRWRIVAQAPFSRATAPTVVWNGAWIVVSGERKPAYRSNEIWRVDPAATPAP